jgi:hydroxymethylpyrimidine/phosphomethylpyrimidine kinase
MNKIAKVLTIAGSDSGGGAGIQADIKSISACGAYASSVIASLTAQNTLGVQGIYDVPAEFVAKQISSVMSDIGADAIKTGMLSTSEIIKAVADEISKYSGYKLVVDPVMVAKGGAKLLQDDAVEALKFQLISRADLVTPNIPEAEVLANMKITNETDAVTAAKNILQLGCKAVLIKGGHTEGDELVDLLFDQNGAVTRLVSKRINTKNTHGTGCSYASSIAAYLAQNFSLEESVKKAHEYIYNGILNSLEIGSGHNPINHYWKIFSNK